MQELTQCIICKEKKKRIEDMYNLDVSDTLCIFDSTLSIIGM
jgi:hypothetical protein